MLEQDLLDGSECARGGYPVKPLNSAIVVSLAPALAGNSKTKNLTTLVDIVVPKNAASSAIAFVDLIFNNSTSHTAPNPMGANRKDTNQLPAVVHRFASIISHVVAF
jgi:hypothetical protein